MQGTGIGYMYHWAAAQTAALLGADYFSVDSATTEAMRATCKQSGMRDEYNSESYEGAPGSVVTAALNSAVRKGWKTIMS
jgi:DsbC/DsbD-like thiol-disulfide interchange protein